jgi:hypothetical protein
MLLCLIVIAAFALRLGLVLSYDGYWGVDGGAYWLSVANVLGDEPTGAGFPRPPLAPGWLLAPFGAAFGDDLGYKIWSSAASILPVIPVYLFARRLTRTEAVEPAYRGSRTWVTAGAVGFLLVDLLHAEMFVTGALPLIAFAWLGTAWWAMCSLHEQWNWRTAAVLAGCVGLIPWINQTAAGLAVITLPVYLLALLWYGRKRSVVGLRLSCAARSNPVVSPPDHLYLGSNALTDHPLVRIAPPLFVGGVIALLALPWYMDVLPGNGILKYPGPVVFLTVPTDSAWLQLALAWPLGLLMIWKGEAPWLRSLGVLVILLGTLTVFLSYDETIINIFYRSRYLLPIPFYVGVAWAVWRFAIPWFAKEPRPGLPTPHPIL